LRSDSTLQAVVRDGIDALKGKRDILQEDIRPALGDSLDLDAALESDYPNDPRWDYLLGHTPSRKLIGVESHSAHTREVSVLIRKKQAALEQLRPHLRDGHSVDHWLWVASGNVQILDLDKARRRLDQHGITFVGRQVLARHLPMSEASR
jgi:hypothetical protein